MVQIFILKSSKFLLTAGFSEEAGAGQKGGLIIIQVGIRGWGWGGGRKGDSIGHIQSAMPDLTFLPYILQ